MRQQPTTRKRSSRRDSFVSPEGGLRRGRHRICVVGQWHQASVLAACLADLGHQVCGVGDDEGAARALESARPPVYEPNLGAVLRRNLKAGRLRFTTDFSQGLRGAEFAFLAIDTPVDDQDYPDLSTVLEAARQVGQGMSGDLVLCVASQVPVGTSEHLIRLVLEQNPPWRCDVVYVPEFLRVGRAVVSFRRADRFVIGAQDRRVAQRVAKLYQPLRRPLLITGLRSAEMAKHASNTFLATSISFINEIADLCGRVGADVVEVVSALRLDRRIGSHAFLSPGLGFAGGTLGRDIRALQNLAREHGSSMLLIDSVMAVNRLRVQLVSRRLQRIYGSLTGLQVGVFGLTYKPGTSTLRRSVALEIINDLTCQGVNVKAFDPSANLEEIQPLPRFALCTTPYAAAEGADALVLVTEFHGIRSLDFPRLHAAMRRPVFLDTRNLFDPSEMKALGFTYLDIGRSTDSSADHSTVGQKGVV